MRPGLDAGQGGLLLAAGYFAVIRQWIASDPAQFDLHGELRKLIELFLEGIVPTGAYFQTESTLTKAEIEIATNVINGRWRAAYANYEHEKIGTEQGHLAPDKVTALIAGLPTSFDDPRQQVVYELASALAAARVAPLGLFRRARDLLGDTGIVDVTALVHTFDHLVMGIAEAELTCGPRIGSPDVRRIMPSLAGQVSCKLQSKTSVS